MAALWRIGDPTPHMSFFSYIIVNILYITIFTAHIVRVLVQSVYVGRLVWMPAASRRRIVPASREHPNTEELFM